MRQIITSIAIATAAWVYAAEPSDTIFTARSAREVTVNIVGKAMSIEMKGVNDDPSSVITISNVPQTSELGSSLLSSANKCESTSRWTFICGGLGLGVNFAPGAPEGMDIQPGSSLNIGLLYALGATYDIPSTHSALMMGLGIDWRTYRMAYPGSRFVLADGNVGLGSWGEDIAPEYSQLRLFSVTLPLLWRQQLPIHLPGCSRMSVIAGPIVAVNVHGSLKNKYTDTQANTIIQSSDDIRQRIVTVDLFGCINLTNWLGLYVRYSPMTILRAGGIPFRSLSTGIMLAL